MLVIFVSFSANLVKNEPWEYTQPDGSVLSLYISGDEYYHRVHDADGFTILQDPNTGYAVYAVPDGNGIKASDHRVGGADPRALGINPGLMQDPQITRQAIANHKAALGTADDRAPSTGTINNIFIFCRFDDQSEFTTPLSTYDTMCNSTTSASMRGYFLEESNSQLTVNTTFYPAAVGGIVRSYQDSFDRAYYLPYNATTNPIGYPAGPADDPDYYGYVRLQTMMRAAIVSVSGGIPGGLVVDGDGDGKVDNVTFVVQGATGGWGDPLWPHHWTLHLPSAVYINTKRVWDYNMQLSSTIDVGVICHEMSHSMGFPDLYHYDPDYDHLTPAGAWDLMEWDQNVPQHHLTHMKRKYGEWFATVPTITPSATPTQYTLTAIDQSPYSCYKINSSLANEYYMLEYRRKTGTYENSIPASGLIIYRIISTFDGDALDGNAWGPPDEVYIYRPNGTITADGSIGSAHFSSNVSRTALHNYTNPKPWLYSDAGTSLDGNLVITEVGASGGTTITFTVRNDPPNIWDGSGGTNWDLAANWSQNSVPTSTQWVEIPAGLTNYPYVATTTPTCKNLKIYSGASLTISTGTLNVMEDVDCYGTITVNNGAGNLYVGDDIVFQSGSTAIFTADGEYWIGGDMNLESGCNVNLDYGYIDFSGTSPSYIRCYQASALKNLRSHKTGSFLSISNLSTAQLTINGNFWTYDGSTSYCAYAGTVVFKSSILSYTGGLVSFNTGIASFEGSSSGSIYFEDAGNFLNHLTINKTSATTYLSSDAWVKGNVLISSGGFSGGEHTLKVGGNWTNSVGTSGFSEGTSNVVFNGTGSQTIGSETFYALELNKSAGMMYIPSGSTVSCTSYDWTAGSYTVSGGTFTVADLVDSGIMGTIVLSSGTINYTQNSSQYIDLRANLTISNGVFNVIGGNSACYFSYVDIATLTMSGGVLDIQDWGIYIPSGYAFNDNITGGTIKTSKGFSNNRADFNPTGGTLLLYGNTDATLLNTAGSNLFNLTIEKEPVRGASELALADFEVDRFGHRTPITRSNTVYCEGPIDINGTLTIQAGTFVAPATINIAGWWTNLVGPAAFSEGTGTVTFDGTGHQYCNYSEDFNILVINKSGGALRVNNSSATVTCNTYTWTAGAVDVLIGTFTAEDLSQNGIYGNFYVNPGGTINLYQGTDQWIDLNGFFYTTGGGTINVYGGSLDCYLAYSADAGISMTGGDIWFRDRGLYFSNTSYDLTWSITTGFIRAKGSYTDTRGGITYAGGTVDLFGPGAHIINLAAGSSFNNLSINKTSTRDASYQGGVEVIESHGRTQINDTRDNSITLYTNITVNGTLTISAGIFNVEDHTVVVNNDLAIWGTLKMQNPAGFVDVNDDVMWQSTGVSSVTAGTIYCGGGWGFANGCSVDLTGSLARMDAPYGETITNNSPTAKFGTLEIYGTEEEPEFGYVPSVPSNYLLVQNNLRVYPESTLNLVGNNCTVGGWAQIDATGAITLGGAGTLTINGDLTLNGNLSTTSGTVDVNGEFYNASTAYLSIYGGTFRVDAPWAEPYVVILTCGLYLDNGLLQITNKTFNIQPHASRLFNNGTLNIGGGFIATSDNCYRPTGGSLNLIGGNNPILQVSGNNFISNLNIQKTSIGNSVFLYNNTVVTGNVTLSSGRLQANDYNLTVGGNWTNIATLSGFSAGTGIVIFNKAGSTQTVTGPITFCNVNDAHTGAALDFQGQTGITGILNVTSIVTFQNAATLGTVNNNLSGGIMAFYGAYNSAIASYNGNGALRSYTGSQVTIGDLVQNGLYGSFIADNGHLIFNQDAYSWIDLNGPVTIANGGIIDIYGGNMSCYLAYSGSVAFTMSSGEFNVHNWGIVLSNTSYSLSLAVSGGTITSNGGFTDSRGNFNPTGGTVRFAGASDANSTLTGTSYFHHVLVNKVSTRETDLPMFEPDHAGNSIPVTRTASLTFGGSPVINGTFTIQAANSVNLAGNMSCLNAGEITINSGTLDLNGWNLTTTGNITVYGTIRVPAPSMLSISHNKSLSVYSGGYFVGVGSAINYATVTRNGTGNYVFNIESGGTVSALYTVFEYMSLYGVRVKTGGMVDPVNSFNHCIFRNGVSAGRLLTLDNNQTIVIDYASFPVPGTVGSYNVAKTANQGTVTFTNYSGDFSGAAYELDTYNRIHWTPLGIPAITDLQIERYGVNDVRLTWSYSSPFTQFNIYAASSPAGPFSLAGSTTNTYWVGSTSNPKAFYHVKVYLP